MSATSGNGQCCPSANPVTPSSVRTHPTRTLSQASSAKPCGAASVMAPSSGTYTNEPLASACHRCAERNSCSSSSSSSESCCIASSRDGALPIIDARLAFVGELETTLVKDGARGRIVEIKTPDWASDIEGLVSLSMLSTDGFLAGNGCDAEAGSLAVFDWYRGGKNSSSTLSFSVSSAAIVTGDAGFDERGCASAFMTGSRESSCASAGVRDSRAFVQVSTSLATGSISYEEG